MVKVYLGSTYDGPLIQRLPDDVQLTDLPAVRSWAEALRDKGMEDGPMTPPCQPLSGAIRPSQEEGFLDRLSEMVADILALSLLLAEGTIGPKKIDWLVLYNQNRFRWPVHLPSNGLPSAIRPLLRDTNRCKAGDLLQELFKHVFKLVGHEASEHVDNGRWVASSFRGQVILPRFLLAEPIEIPTSGFACLSLFAGTILLEKEKDRRFHWILSEYPGRTQWSYVSEEVSPKRPLSARTNPFPDDKIEWQLTKKVDHLIFTMRWAREKTSGSPLSSLFGLGVSVMMENCSHSEGTDLEQQRGISLIGPKSCPTVMVGGVDEVSETTVYLLHGNEALRIFALAAIGTFEDMSFDAEESGSPDALINKGACINCAVRVCELQGIRCLIL
ncbi:uncharacterized protein Z520_06492 [Fonsecaea multimorphosa CBS 102226]|uniref:Uncharacterized protein n=1 Tax=Fonsecaea multimorphosa CBS 102226 TaxID=1442371 RepID=A0A0D2K3G6_9EURO|nr:uncharacterized protein Z520_06492 [Fonsecaea multimorphosa CBS 102226]KIX97714.1 hypothetical protein Z520_06492 [Fonsecaea multimorphosa CBS 102226]